MTTTILNATLCDTVALSLQALLISCGYVKVCLCHNKEESSTNMYITQTSTQTLYIPMLSDTSIVNIFSSATERKRIACCFQICFPAPSFGKKCVIKTSLKFRGVHSQPSTYRKFEKFKNTLDFWSVLELVSLQTKKVFSIQNGTVWSSWSEVFQLTLRFYTRS